MSKSGDKIIPPIGLEELYTELGVGKTNGRYDVSYLCSNEHGKINKWAKHKPERIDSPVPINDEQRKYNNFGLSPTVVYTSVNDAIEAAKNGYLGGWAYDAPRPGEDYARMSDFDGYIHNSPSPFGYLKDPTEIVLQKTGSTEMMLPILIPNPFGEFIVVSDFSGGASPYKQWYPGIVMYNQRKTIWATGTATFEESGSGSAWNIDLGTVTQSDIGTYTAVLFISSKLIPKGSYINDPRIIFTGDRASVIVEEYVSPYSISITAQYKLNSLGGVLCNVTLTCWNNTPTAAVFHGLYLRAAKDYAGTSAQNVGTIGDIDVPANGSKTVKEEINFTGLFGSAAWDYKFIKAFANDDKVKDTTWTAIMSNDFDGPQTLE